MARREQRFPADSAVQITHSGEVYQALACDVSLNGVCVAGMQKLPPGSQVTICCLGLVIQARVAWSKDFFTGLQFDVPLEAADLQAFLAISLA